MASVGAVGGCADRSDVRVQEIEFWVGAFSLEGPSENGLQVHDKASLGEGKGDMDGSNAFFVSLLASIYNLDAFTATNISSSSSQK